MRKDPCQGLVRLSFERATTIEPAFAVSETGDFKMFGQPEHVTPSQHSSPSSNDYARLT